MIKRVLQFFDLTITLFIVSIIALIITTSSPIFLKFVANKYIKPMGVTYKEVSGSIFSKIVLKKVKYLNVFEAKKITINYNILNLLSKKIDIDNILINSPKVNLLKLKSKGSKPFKKILSIRRVKIENLTLVKKRRYFIDDIAFQDIKYDGKTSIKKIKAIKKDKKYGNFTMDASLKSNIIKGSIRSNSINLEKIVIKDMKLLFDYPLNDKKVNFKAKYFIEKKEFKLFLKQSGFATIRGKYNSKIFGKIIKSPLSLPSNIIKANLFGDTKKVTIEANLGSLLLNIDSDYKNFLIKSSIKDIKIDKIGQANFKSLSTLKIMPFNLNTSFKLQSRLFKMEVNASDINFSNGLESKKVKIRLNYKRYGKAILKGFIKSDKLVANAKLYPLKKYLKNLNRYPYPLLAKIIADKKGISIFTNSNKLSFKTVKDLMIKNLKLYARYPFDSKKMNFRASYLTQYKKNILDINQSGFFKENLESNITAKIVSSPIKLPFKRAILQLKADDKNIFIDVAAGVYKAKINGDYKNFHIKGFAKLATFGFMPNFPNIIKNELFTMETDANLSLYPLLLKGSLNVKSSMGAVEANYKLKKQNQLFRAIYKPNPNYKIYKNYDISKISPANITLYKDSESKILNIDANALNVTLFKHLNTLGGWGNIEALMFNLNGKIDKNGIALEILAKLHSLKKFLTKIGYIRRGSKTFFDGEVNLNSKLLISKNIKFISSIEMPYFEVAIDKENLYKGKNLSINSTFNNRDIVINRYSFNILKHHIYSYRPSKLKITKDKKVEFKKFWIFDNLKLQGIIDPLNHLGKLHIKGQNIHYKSKEATLEANADLVATIDKDQKQSIKGKITILNGVINKEFKREYNSLGNDIIVIQDIKENRRLKRYIDIQIDSKKPIKYKTKDIDLQFIPDFLIYQEEGKPIEYLGMITIPKGVIQKGGKSFKLLKSKIYLRGANPPNPYLNINVFYLTPSHIKIKIHILNTLASPLMILASDPPMNTNDIMSYLLFDKRASNAFSDESSSQRSISLGAILYSTGIKQLLQQSTHIKIGTLNILSTKDKKFGYELGVNLNDKIRVVYKNDEISSIIIQYALNRYIIIDVNVKETGEDVYILYSKDF